MNTRSLQFAYIGLGSNLEDPISQVRDARTALARHPDLFEKGFSRLYSSKPMGPKNQPDYVNAVMLVETALLPHDLLLVLQQIENSQGRVRLGERWGPRTLDLDLLLYADQIIDTADLKVPHPGVTQRSFVLFPLRDLAPKLEIPGSNKTVERLCDLCSSDDLVSLT